ncbi:ATP-binding protein [Microbacterium marinilacus]|nr:ATP-binding protein [Microbacterium marinilacus]MBY0690206.1 response regulator [Microbacterium marinilacus]
MSGPHAVQRGDAQAASRPAPTQPIRERRRSVARRFLVEFTLVLLAGAAVVFAGLAFDAHTSANAQAARTSTDLATTLAIDPTVVQAVAQAHEEAAADPEGAVTRASARLQPYVEGILRATGVDYVTIMDSDRTRYTHANPERIGGDFLGTIEPALEGETFTEVYPGTLGPSVRAVTPVLSGGEVVGLVSAGVTLENVTEAILVRLQIVGLFAVVVVGLGALAAVMLFRRLDRVTDGRDPDELARLFAAHEAVLHSLEEGLLLIERRPGHAPRVVLANDQALRMLGIDRPAPFAVDDAGLPEDVHAVLAGDDRDEVVRIAAKDLLVAREQTELAGRSAEILTLRDRTELRRVTGELSSVRTISDALRAQAHEFDNRLHTIATLIELGQADEALTFAASERDLGQRLADRVLHAVDEPVIAALMLGKAAQAHERAVEMHFETHLAPGTQGLQPADVVTILGNLIDNATDAAASRAARTGDTDAWVEVYLASADDGSLVFQVSDSGDGVAEADRDRIFRRGYSTKDTESQAHGYGLTLVRQVVEGLGGTIEVTAAPGGGAVFTAILPAPEPAGGGERVIRVLVVEDDARTAAAHAEYVRRLDGFDAVGVALTVSAARRALRDAVERGERIHLLLLDLNLPDGHGLDLCRELRASGLIVDVIAVTAVRELESVRQAVAVGVVQYLIKPFVFEVFAQKLAAYKDFFDRMRAPVSTLSQREVDTAFAALRTSNAPGLPKGLSEQTLDAVSDLLAAAASPRSATEVAERLGLSRVTARRYLEHLADRGVAVRAPRHGARGRPELEYSRPRPA